MDSDPPPAPSRKLLLAMVFIEAAAVVIKTVAPVCPLTLGRSDAQLPSRSQLPGRVLCFCIMLKGGTEMIVPGTGQAAGCQQGPAWALATESPALTPHWATALVSYVRGVFNLVALSRQAWSFRNGCGNG